MTDIKLIEFIKKNVGNFIKNSKIKYSWVLKHDGVIINLDVFESKMSGKYRIFFNDKLHKLLSKINNNYFEETINHLDMTFKVIKNNSEYELLVNNKKLNTQEVQNTNEEVDYFKTFDTDIKFIDNFEVKNSKNINEYISKKEMEINEKTEYYYI